MAKIMLVEDDNNLREIYGARLQAEGHTIVAAKDGEEALALAVKEKPELIISDVMMPRISGFDMLDILRNAPETKNTKVIMMTALSQAEDKSRADNLGADRYLVKSQVTLEDVANVVREVLTGEGEATPVSETIPTATANDQAAAPETPVPNTPSETPQSTNTEAPASPEVTLPPAPKVPEIVEVAEVASPAQVTPTVDNLANPPADSNEDTDTSNIQAPPASSENASNDTPSPESSSLNTSSAADNQPANKVSIPVQDEPLQVTMPQTSTPSAADTDTDSVATPPANDSTAGTSAPTSSSSISTSDDDNLPPVVEPAQPVAISLSSPITVTLPTPPDESSNASSQNDSSSSNDAASDSTHASSQSSSSDSSSSSTDNSDNESSVVGPNLAEALAAEESQATQQPSQELETDDSGPIIANGAAVTPVTAPQQASGSENDEVPVPPAPTADNTNEDSDSQTPSSSPAPAAPDSSQPAPRASYVSTPPSSMAANESTASASGEPQANIDQPQAHTSDSPTVAGKKVIQPISDPSTAPSIEDLLAEEERKAAVSNPVANTVITPGNLPANETEVNPQAGEANTDNVPTPPAPATPTPASSNDDVPKPPGDQNAQKEQTDQVIKPETNPQSEQINNIAL